jgi:hypothetical protein
MPRRRRSVALAAALAAAVAACGGDDDQPADPDAGDVDAAVDAATDARIDAPIDAAIDADVTMLPRFSFFVTSLRALRQLSGNQNGFGGDLRFGETGPGAGLRGADKLCATIADRSLPGASAKQWRAFLSATSDGNGNVVHAIDRIGNGPWYDRLGRLLAPDRASLMATRPLNGDPTIRNDFPNEDGVPNHNPDGTGQVDNHDMLTATNTQGQLITPAMVPGGGALASTSCLDWTASAGNIAVEGRPWVGHSWPRGTTGSGAHWMSSLLESGCAPGVNLIEMGGPLPGSTTVGSGGGYGGFYCFALVP